MAAKKINLPNLQISSSSMTKPPVLPRFSTQKSPRIEILQNYLFPSVSPIKPANLNSINTSRRASFDQQLVSKAKCCQSEGQKIVSNVSYRSNYTVNNLADENYLIQQRANTLLKKLSSFERVLDNSLDNDIKAYQSFYQTHSNFQEIIRISEEILELHNIKLDIIDTPMIDSLMEIQEIIHDGTKLASCLLILIPLIARFPYSFLKKSGIRTLKFCQDVNLFKPFKDSMVNARLMSGIIPLNKLQSEEKITNYFFSILLHHLKRAISNFDEIWMRFKLPSNRQVYGIRQSPATLKKGVQKKSSSLNQAKVLRDFLLNQHDSIGEQYDISKLKKFFEEFDGDGMREEWWTKSMDSTLCESIRF